MLEYDADIENKVYLPLICKREVIVLTYSFSLSRLASIRVYIPDVQRKGYSVVDDLVLLDRSLGVSIVEYGNSPDTHEVYDKVLEKGVKLEQYNTRAYLKSKHNINFIINDILERRYKEKYNIDFLEDFYCSKDLNWYANENMMNVADDFFLHESMRKNFKPFISVSTLSSYVNGRYADFYKFVNKALSRTIKLVRVDNNKIDKKEPIYILEYHPVIETKKHVRGKLKVYKHIDASKTTMLSLTWKELKQFCKANNIPLSVVLSKTAC